MRLGCDFSFIFCFTLIIQFSSLLAGVRETQNITTLNSENYDEITKEGMWLLLFWDDYCQHSLTFQPIFADFADRLKGEGHPLHFGAIHVNLEENLAIHLNTTGHPVVKFKRNGFFDNYDGGRLPDQLYAWSQRLLEKPTNEIKNQEYLSIQNDKTQHETVFVFVYEAEHQKLGREFQAYSIVADAWHASYDFHLTSDPEVVQSLRKQTDRFPLIVALNDEEQYPIYNGSWITEEVMKWFKDHRFFLYPELDALNYVDFTTEMQDKVTLVLVDDTLAANSAHFQAVFKATAPLVKDFARIGWVNGLKQREYKVHFKLHDLPDYFVVHSTDKLHFHHEHVRGEMSVDHLIEFLHRVHNGDIEAQNSDLVGFQLFVSKNWPILAKIVFLITASGMCILVVAFIIMINQKGERPIKKKKTKKD